MEIVASGVTQVSAGNMHSLFLKSDGSLYGMGSNSHGQLGDGTNTQRNSPVQIIASGVAKLPESILTTNGNGGGNNGGGSGSSAGDGVPSLVNFRGKLSDAQGNPVTGSVAVTVKVFGQEAGGNAVYSEAIGSVQVKNGLYAFRFGGSGQPDLVRWASIR